MYCTIDLTVYFYRGYHNDGYPFDGNGNKFGQHLPTICLEIGNVVSQKDESSFWNQQRKLNAIEATVSSKLDLQDSLVYF